MKTITTFYLHYYSLLKMAQNWSCQVDCDRRPTVWNWAIWPEQTRVNIDVKQKITQGQGQVRQDYLSTVSVKHAINLSIC